MASDVRHDDVWAKVPVRLRDNPGKRGTATGRVTGDGDRLRVEVRFGPHEVSFRPAVVLVREDPTPPSPIDRLIHGGIGVPTDLRRLLTFQKVRGQLTNVLYSMERSNTDYYPNQLKPVLMLLHSSQGRLQVAG